MSARAFRTVDTITVTILPRFPNNGVFHLTNRNRFGSNLANGFRVDLLHVTACDLFKVRLKLVKLVNFTAPTRRTQAHYNSMSTDEATVKH